MSTQDDINNAKANMLKKMEKIVRAGAIGCFQEIVVGSPVDSGRFRANWQASVNNPNYNTVLDGVKSKTDGHGKVIKNQFPQTDDVIGHTVDYTLDGVLFLTNNLPYAVRLAHGWSQQRGDGWVDTAVQNAKNNIKLAAGQ
jgi:hypothetical protein